MKHLYLLTTKGLGDFYIIADDPSDAENSLLKILNDQDYGFDEQRRIVNIKWLAETLKPSYNDKTKPFLADKSTRLLITQNWRNKNE